MIRVLLVDDHAVVRMGFRLLLQSRQDLSVVAEAESGEAACQLYAELAPDVVVMDLAMPGMGGLEALRRIRAKHPQARVLTLSAHDDPMHARRALQEGALGFLSKRSAPEVLLEAVTAVARAAATSMRRSRRSSRWRNSTAPPNRRWSGFRSANSRCSCGLPAARPCSASPRI
jgi:DNA-binding NarL/FixJ family response regulator